jgi:vitamin B12 transporter
MIRIRGSRSVSKTRSIRASSSLAAVLLCLDTTLAAAQTALPPVVVEGASRAARAPQTAVPAAGGTVRQGAPDGGAGSGSAADGTNTESEAGFTVSAGDLLANQGAAVTVVSGEELRAAQVRVPVDALRSLPGVTVGRVGAFAGLAQVRIRGAEGNQTLVLIDGSEANNPADGEFDFSNIVGTDDIERIEVLRGAQSGIYGSGAIGGVINIVTRSGRGPLTLSSRAEYGSFNTRDASATLSAGNSRAWGLFSTHTRRTGGYNISATGLEKDGSVTTSSMAKVGFSPMQGLTIEGFIRHTGKNGNRDDENYAVPLGSLIEQTDSLSRFSSNLWLGALEGKLSLFGDRWVQSIRGERRSITNDDFSAPFSNFDRYRANAETYRYTSTFRLDTPGVPGVRHFLTGLAEMKHEGFVQHTDSDRDYERKTQSIAGEVRGEYWNNVFLTGSIRQDDVDVFGAFTTWRTTASLKLPETPFRLHGSYGTGLKMPSLFEQYGRSRVVFGFVPNANLKPETSEGWDAGVEMSFLNGRLVVDATWFEMDVKDKITAVFSPVYTAVNVPGINARQGLELAGRITPLPGLTVGASYTLLEAFDAAGLTELRRPRDTARIDAVYTFDRDRARIGVSAVYNGVMQDTAFKLAPPCFFGFCSITPERVDLKDYWLVGATASYKLAPQLEAYGRVENLLDQRYQEVYGFGSAGAAVYGGLRLTLQDTSFGAARPTR